MKIICAGFPKTGTKSMALALRYFIANIFMALDSFNVCDSSYITTLVIIHNRFSPVQINVNITTHHSGNLATLSMITQSMLPLVSEGKNICAFWATI